MLTPCPDPGDNVCSCKFLGSKITNYSIKAVDLNVLNVTSEIRKSYILHEIVVIGQTYGFNALIKCNSVSMTDGCCIFLCWAFFFLTILT